MGYDNLAYKEYTYEEYVPKKRKPQQNKSNKRNHNQMLNRKKSVRRICAILVLSFSAGFMISEFVAVNETKQQIAALEKKLADAESITSQKNYELEKSVDLAKIEEEATTRLGMQRPEKYQTIYVNVKQGDVTAKTASDVEGPLRRIGTALKKLGGNIVEFFSIE